MLKLKIVICIISLYLFTCKSTLGQENLSLTKTEIDSILLSQISGNLKLDTINLLWGDMVYFRHIIGHINIRTHKGLERIGYLLCEGKIHTERTIQDEWKKNFTKRIVTRYSFINGSFVKFSLEEYNIVYKDSTEPSINKVIYYFNGNDIIDQELKVKDNFKIKKINIDAILKHGQELEDADFSIEPSS